MAKYDNEEKCEHTGIVDTIKKYIHKENIKTRTNLNSIAKDQQEVLEEEIHEIRENQNELKLTMDDKLKKVFY